MMGGVFYTGRSFDDWVNMVGKFRSIALCVFVLLVAYPATASALVGPVDVESPGWNDEPYIAYTLAPDQFTAALNYNRVDADQLNTAQREYLASDSAWLAFQSAIELNNDFGAALLAFPYYAKGPDENLYEVYVDGSVYGAAQSVLRQVLKGEVAGTPSIPDLPTDVEVFDQYEYGLTTFTSGGSTRWTGLSGTVYTTSSALGGYPTVANGVVCYVPKVVFTDEVREKLDNGWQFFIVVYGTGSTYTRDTTAYIVPDGVLTTGVTSSYSYFNIPYGTTMMRWPGASSYVDNDGDVHVVFTKSNSAWDTFNWNSTGNTRFNPYIFIYHGSVDIPTEPDPTPQPPVQPTDPGTDVPTVDPPTWPTIDFPDITIHGAPITITWPTIADNADYTQLLKEIIKRLEKIGDLCGDIVNDMADHCEHLEQAIQDAAEYIVDNLELGIDPDLDDLVRGIDNAWRKITQTIKEQVKWLADQLDYDFTVTLDLDKIEQYLRRIISKMGGGTSKPDPTNDPFDWGDWLDDLWRKIFTALQIMLPDELGQLLELFDVLKTKFPFCVPFDLIAIVAVFDHAPVAPVVDLPYPTITSQGVGYLTITVDASTWEDTMIMVRDIETLLFAAYLISQTHWALDSIDPKGGK